MLLSLLLPVFLTVEESVASVEPSTSTGRVKSQSNTAGSRRKLPDRGEQGLSDGDSDGRWENV